MRKANTAVMQSKDCLQLNGRLRETFLTLLLLRLYLCYYEAEIALADNSILHVTFKPIYNNPPSSGPQNLQ